MILLFDRLRIVVRSDSLGLVVFVNSCNSRHSEKTENLASSVDFRLIQNLSMLIFMSCADCGNFLCKKFHKTSHTLHSLITRKFNEPHERSAKLSSENAGCLQDFSDDTESRLTRMWFKNYETMTVFVVCFTNELLFIPLSWQFDSVICCLKRTYSSYAFI